MHVIGAVVAERLDIGAFEQRQSLQQDRSLAPGAAGEDFEIAEAAALGRPDRRMIAGEVLGREEAAFGLHKGDDLLGDVAAIEGVARRFEPGIAAVPVAAARGSRLFLVGHVLQRGGEIGLAEHLPGLERAAVRQQYRRRRRPTPQPLLLLFEAGGHQRVHRKTVAREPGRGGGDLAKAHRAVAPQCGDPGIGRGRDDGAQHAERDLAAMLAHKKFGVERLWPSAEPGDGDDFALFGVIDHDRRDAGKIDQVDLQDAERDAGGDPGIDRVAARLQDVETGRRGEVMASRDRMPGHRDRRAMGGVMRGRGHGVPPGNLR